MQLPYNQAIVLLGIYPRDMKNYVHRKTFIWLLTVALFIIRKKTQVAFNGWMVKTNQWHIHTQGILLRNKKEWTTDICNNLDKSAESDVE